MTNARVVDTNVILVANEAHDDASPECVKACVSQLGKLMKSGVLVVDDNYKILMEYQNKTSTKKSKKPGDLFVKWALQNMNRKDKVHQVPLTQHSENKYAEFPDPELEKIFDAPDRKFVAVAHKHPERPPVWQAVDCKWLDWWEPLKQFGITIEFLCKDDACRFYSKKFPKKPAPKLP